MASEGPPRTEAILCVRVPCREGRERVWQAIELLRQEQRQPQQASMPEPGRRPATRHCQVVGDDSVTRQQQALSGCNVHRPDA